MGSSTVGAAASGMTSLLLEPTLQQTITSGSGSFTVTKPSLLLIAGGGGGGGGTSGSGGTQYSGGGGGVAGILGTWLPSGTYTYAVGAGGIGGVATTGGRGGTTWVAKEYGGASTGYGWAALGGGGGGYQTAAGLDGADLASLGKTYNWVYARGSGGGGGYTQSNGGGSPAYTTGTVGVLTSTGFPTGLTAPHPQTILYGGKGVGRAACWYLQSNDIIGASGVAAAGTEPTSMTTINQNSIVNALSGCSGGGAVYASAGYPGGYFTTTYNTVKVTDLTTLVTIQTSNGSTNVSNHFYSSGGAGGNGILGVGAIGTLSTSAATTGGAGGQGGGGGGSSGAVTTGISMTGGAGGSGCILIWN